MQTLTIGVAAAQLEDGLRHVGGMYDQLGTQHGALRTKRDQLRVTWADADAGDFAWQRCGGGLHGVGVEQCPHGVLGSGGVTCNG